MSLEGEQTISNLKMDQFNAKKVTILTARSLYRTH